jgi:hypothetical protein
MTYTIDGTELDDSARTTPKVLIIIEGGVVTYLAATEDVIFLVADNDNKRRDLLEADFILPDAGIIKEFENA